MEVKGDAIARECMTLWLQVGSDGACGWIQQLVSDIAGSVMLGLLWVVVP